MKIRKLKLTKSRRLWAVEYAPSSPVAGPRRCSALYSLPAGAGLLALSLDSKLVYRSMDVRTRATGPLGGGGGRYRVQSRYVDGSAVMTTVELRDVPCYTDAIAVIGTKLPKKPTKQTAKKQARKPAKKTTTKSRRRGSA